VLIVGGTGRLPGLLPEPQRRDVSPWGPAVALDGDRLVVAWAQVKPEVNLRQVPLGG
jgi:hypothetical protein